MDKFHKIWYVIVTEDNIEILGKWRFNGEVPSRFLPGAVVGVHPNYPNDKDWNNSYTNDWINEITFDEFKLHILKEDIIIEPIKEDYSYLSTALKQLKIE